MLSSTKAEPSADLSFAKTYLHGFPGFIGAIDLRGKGPAYAGEFIIEPGSVVILRITNSLCAAMRVLFGAPAEWFDSQGLGPKALEKVCPAAHAFAEYHSDAPPHEPLYTWSSAHYQSVQVATLTNQRFVVASADVQASAHFAALWIRMYLEDGALMHKCEGHRAHIAEQMIARHRDAIVAQFLSASRPPSTWAISSSGPT